MKRSQHIHWILYTIVGNHNFIKMKSHKNEWWKMTSSANHELSLSVYNLNIKVRPWPSKKFELFASMTAL